MFTELSNVITQSVVPAFNSSSTYVENDRVLFSDVVYVRNTGTVSQAGLTIQFTANSTGNNNLVRIRFFPGGSLISGTSGITHIDFINSSSTALSLPFGSVLRTPAPLTSTIAEKIVFWTDRINADASSLGVNVELTNDGTDTITIYCEDNTVEFGSSVQDINIANGTFAANLGDISRTVNLTDSGNPDVNPVWIATTELSDTDSLLDTENIGLTVLPSITYEILGPVNKYNIAATAKFINGLGTTLNMNTDLSRVIPHRPTENGSGTAFLVKGIVNYGVEKGNAGEGVFTDGLGLYFPELGALWYNGSFGGAVGNCSFGLDGGTLNLYGGTIAGGLTFTPDSDSTINVYAPTRFIADQEGSGDGQQPIIRWNDVTIVIHEGGSLSFDSFSISITKNSGDATFSGDLVGKGVGIWIQGLLNCSNTNPDGNYTTILNSSAKGKDVDIAPYTDAPQTARHAVCIIRNWKTGSDNNINGGETGATDQNSGVYFMAVQDIETNIKSLTTGNDITGVIFINGKNRFDDLLAPIEEVEGDGVDYFDDDAIIKYTIKYDGAITDFNSTGGYAGDVLLPETNLKAIVQYTHQVNYVDGTARARGTQDVDEWKKALCSESGIVGQDDFVKVNYSFGYIPTVETSVFQDQKVVTVVENLTDSIVTSVTEAEAKTLSDNATGLSWTANALTLTEAVTSDNIVNIAHYRKQFDSTHRDLPNIESLAIDADGSTLNLNALTTEGITGSGEIQVSGKHTTIEHDVSLNCSKFTGTIKTLKSPTLTNLDTNPGEFEKYDGSHSSTANFTFTPHIDGDVSKLALVIAANTTFTSFNKQESDYLSVDTTATGAVFVYDQEFDISVLYPQNAISGLLQILNSDTGALIYSSTSVGTIISNTAGTGKTQVSVGTNITVLFSSQYTDDYITSRTANSQATNVSISVGLNVVPQSPVAPVAGLITASYSTVTNKLSLSISVSLWNAVAGRDRETDTYLNEAICTQVKETTAYQQLMFNHQSDKFRISSLGDRSSVGISDRCLLTATSEVDLPYVTGYSATTGIKLVETLSNGVYTTANAPIESGSVHLAVTPQDQGLSQEVIDSITSGGDDSPGGLDI